eukprot:CAMPEP_0114494036 /NCGR_PEP_ID=MMETSP0109-20121206/4433_1 /TAXON_ID=29199 /ORGANISM="Chlorarachnion reptans, Strain CCCM449" /LENGTH=116 /DNA_ID=CAMNT_0001671037 /DNA_START=906 /DNA_END=1256 /DNA_ORIENTATION=+
MRLKWFGASSDSKDIRPQNVEDLGSPLWPEPQVFGKEESIREYAVTQIVSVDTCCLQSWTTTARRTHVFIESPFMGDNNAIDVMELKNVDISGTKLKNGRMGITELKNNELNNGIC